jgi:hypothetical protein
MTVEAVREFLAGALPQISGIYAIEAVGPLRSCVRTFVNERQLRPGGTIWGPTVMGLADVSLYAAILGSIGPVDERALRHAVGVRPRRIVEAEPFDLAHARDEKAGIEPTHHVALRLVGAGAKIVAVEDAGIGMDAAAAIALVAGRTAQRWRMMRRVVPQPLRLPELTRGFVGGPAVHLTVISAVSPNNPTR